MADGSAAPRLKLAARIAQEFWCSMLCWFKLFPFGGPFERRIDGDTSLPVLLLHGYGANSGFWQTYSQQLQRAGISHAAIDLEPVLAGIDDYATVIEEAVQSLCRACGTAQVILLCHSMGGLAARAWLRACGSQRAARIITLGTPHFGSTLAGYGLGKNARQVLTPAGDASSWIAQLDASENAELRSLFVSVGTRHDNIVSPQSSALLPGATNITLDLVGHVALGFDAGVGEQVLAEIMSVRRSRSISESR
jgi:triacylglycerol esterase/lipase EstA (alpha/beta hydrolase family)